MSCRRGPRVRLVAQMDGGGHERGMRSGTLNVPSIVGMGQAAELLAQRERAREARDYATSDHLREQLADMGVVVTDSREGQKWKVASRV